MVKKNIGSKENSLGSGDRGNTKSTSPEVLVLPSLRLNQGGEGDVITLDMLIFQIKSSY